MQTKPQRVTWVPRYTIWTDTVSDIVVTDLDIHIADTDYYILITVRLLMSVFLFVRQQTRLRDYDGSLRTPFCNRVSVRSQSVLVKSNLFLV